MDFLKYIVSREWYHGDTSRRTSFRDQHMDRDSTLQDSNAFGPGLYLTSNFQEALGYASGGFVYTVEVRPHGKILTETIRSNKHHVKRLIGLCPDDRREIGLSNWDENPVTAMSKAVSEYSKFRLLDASLTIYHDFYGSFHANDWSTAMVALGYDGLIHPANNSIYHLAIYNLKTILILDEHKHEDIE